MNIDQSLNSLRKKGLKATEIHTEMVKVLGEFSLLKTMICKWANLFKSGHTSLGDDPCEEHLKLHQHQKIIVKIQDMTLKRSSIDREGFGRILRHFIKHSKEFF